MSASSPQPPNDDDRLGAVPPRKAGIRDTFRKNKRPTLIVGGAIGVVAVYLLFFSGGVTPSPSTLGSIPPSNTAEGGHPVSEERRNNLRTADQQRAQEATKNLTSAMPTIVKDQIEPVAPPAALIPAHSAAPAGMVDPTPSPTPRAQMAVVNPQIQAQQMQQMQQARDQKIAAMQAALSKQNINVGSAQLYNYVSASGVAGSAQQTQPQAQISSGPGQAGPGTGPTSRSAMALNQAGGTAGANPSSSPQTLASVLSSSAVPSPSTPVAYNQGSLGEAPRDNTQGPFVEPVAGSRVQAETVSRIDSDSPGPVIAKITSGPLNGARLLGRFQTRSDSLTFTFTSMQAPFSDDEGQQQVQVVPIHAIAVDDETLNTSMATSVDRHLLPKIGIALGSAFLQGFGQALASSGATTQTGIAGQVVTTNPLLSTGKELAVAGGQAAGAAGQIAEQAFGSLATTIIVDPHTPFSLLFVGDQGAFTQ